MIAKSAGEVPPALFVLADEICCAVK